MKKIFFISFFTMSILLMCTVVYGSGNNNLNSAFSENQNHSCAVCTVSDIKSDSLIRGNSTLLVDISHATVLDADGFPGSSRGSLSSDSFFKILVVFILLAILLHLTFKNVHNKNHKKCPHCGQSIHVKETVCPKCGKDLTGSK